MPDQDPTNESRSVLAVERAFDVLGLFDGQRNAWLGVTEIAQRLGFSKTIAHRLLTALTLKRVMVFDERTKLYSLGPTALTLGMSYLSGISVRERARPVLIDLSERTEETAILSIRAGYNRVYVDQVTPEREVRVTVTLGHPYPLHAGAPSKVFLAFLSREHQETYIASELTSFTPETIIDPSVLRDELETIRSVGHAISTGERRGGLVSVAAPVFDHERTVTAVISVCGPSERFLPRLSSVAPLLMEATSELSGTLGYRHDVSDTQPHATASSVQQPST